MNTLVWFRRDLRVDDNPALYNACRDKDNRVIALYLITPDFWQSHDEAPIKLSFWLQNLAVLQRNLEILNIPLLVLSISTATLLVEFTKILKKYTIEKLFFNTALEPDEYKRDQGIITLCKEQHVNVERYQQSCILPPGSVVKTDGSPYCVFTAFKKKWWSQLHPDDHDCYPKPSQQTQTNIQSTHLSVFLQQYSVNNHSAHWPAGEAAAQHRLQHFCQKLIDGYDVNRDLPAITGTSHLSPYLTAGVLSTKQCLQAVLQLKQTLGVQTWINELIWRDFYQHILSFFPRVGKHQAFKRETEKIKWNDNPAHFTAWCNGKTGVPIVDAAMRQLNQTGWMHNRLRMVVAMFFTKNLFLNWRLGERYFMQQLIDGDLAANNGGWRWSASTGTDAAPYFRVFNPYRQSERFDPTGKFIRQLCPELNELDNRHIHQPPALASYPKPIVDVCKTRQYAIEQFKSLKTINE